MHQWTDKNFYNWDIKENLEKSQVTTKRVKFIKAPIIENLQIESDKIESVNVEPITDLKGSVIITFKKSEDMNKNKISLNFKTKQNGVEFRKSSFTNQISNRINNHKSESVQSK